jgi:hypothetical protein
MLGAVQNISGFSWFCEMVMEHCLERHIIGLLRNTPVVEVKELLEGRIVRAANSTALVRAAYGLFECA